MAASSGVLTGRPLERGESRTARPDKTDGTPGGTKPFKDRNGQKVSGHITSLQVVGPGEQVLVLRGGTEMAAIGSTLYYTGPAADSGSCLQQDYTRWQSDGTPEGTFEVSPTPSNCQFRALTPVDGALFFVADDGVHGVELWRYVP